MKPRFAIGLTLGLFLLAGTLLISGLLPLGPRTAESAAPVPPAPTVDEKKEESEPEPAEKDEEAARRLELEKEFREALTNVTFRGRWCLIKDGELGPEREETYTIRTAMKAGGDNWLIFARVQFGDKDVTLPVPVQVKWAGDTPVITVTDVNLPGLGTYSARVLVYRDTYAGSWFGKTYGGLMSGQIVQNPKPGEKKDPEGGDEEES